MTITPDLATIIREALDSRLIDIHVALPGAVQSYDATAQTADIELQVKRALPDDDGTFSTEALPVLKNIPVAFPRGADYFISFPLPVGSYGLVIFSEASIDQWRSVGDTVSPGDVGRHTLTGGVFMPGLSPNAEAITDNIAADAVFGKIGGAQLRAKAATIEATSGGGTTAADFVAMAQKVDTLWATLYTLFTTGWTPAPPDGGTALKTAFASAFPAPPASVASTNLKAD